MELNPAEAGETARLEQTRRVVVKVGTSLLTHPGGKLHLGRMEALVRQIADLHAGGREVVLVTSGAIGAGLGRLGLDERPDDLAQKQALAAIGQGILMHTYEKLFAEYGLVVAQVLLTREDLDHAERCLNAHHTLGCLLGWGVVPIVNENDTVANDEIKVGDNDTLSARVAVLVEADLLVILSNVKGLYPADPHEHPHLEPIRHVTALTPALWAAAGGPGTATAIGGMRTKLLAAQICFEQSIPMVLADGGRPGVLADILTEQIPGTLFRATG